MLTGLMVTNASKHFGGLRALHQVDFVANVGEVHALLGQNGSGKSTLVKIITGFHTPDPGTTMTLWGDDVGFPVSAAQELGIAVIHQDLGLVDEMTVLENMAMSTSFSTRLFAPIAMRSERATCQAILDELGLQVHPDSLVAELSPAERATVAIGRAKRVLQEHRDQFVFILDEPTAYLSAEESAQVVELMRSVADAGNAVVFISHRLHEVESVADRITVLRDGSVADSYERGEGDQERAIAAMLGRTLDSYYPEPPPRPECEPALVAIRLSGDRLQDLSFDARPGEIVGFAGLVGMGHEEIPYLVMGAQRGGGQVRFAGHDLLQNSVAENIDAGVALVPGNRQRDGIWPEALVSENIALPQNRRQPTIGRLRHGAEAAEAAQAMGDFGVRPADPTLRLRQFSGGNQQKVVLAKWMRERPDVLLLDEPTQGIDAGAKFDVLSLVCDAAAAGSVVLVASGDYEQLAHVCHRVIVVRFGEAVAELTGDDLSEEAIARYSQRDEVR